ncbi:MAG: ral secretion pathway protein, partial [Pseudomonadota bacterium]
AIVDAQSMYNLRNLVGPDGKVVKEQFDILLRLCDRVSVGPSTALRLANGLRDAVRPGMDSKPEMTDENPDPPLLPERVDQLTWVGVDKESLQRLKPYVTLLPSPQGQNGVQPPPTTININTAPREVIAAVLNIDPPLAESLVQTRARTPFKTMDEVVAKLAPGHVLVPNSVNVTTKHFVVSGRLRLGDQVLEQRSLVQREDTKVTPLTREWVNSNDPG